MARAMVVDCEMLIVSRGLKVVTCVLWVGDVDGGLCDMGCGFRDSGCGIETTSEILVGCCLRVIAISVVSVHVCMCVCARVQVLWLWVERFLMWVVDC